MAFIAVGPESWGKGNSIGAAKRKMVQQGSGKMPKKYIIYDVHESSTVDRYGNMTFPVCHPPKEILRVDRK